MINCRFKVTCLEDIAYIKSLGYQTKSDKEYFNRVCGKISRVPYYSYYALNGSWYGQTTDEDHNEQKYPLQPIIHHPILLSLLEVIQSG